MSPTDHTTHGTLRAALLQAQQQGLQRLDAQMLLLAALGHDANHRAWLLAHDDDTLNADCAARFSHLLQRRLQGEPLAYLRGRQEFFGLSLQIDARVLVPRADTETLVHWALEILDTQHSNQAQPPRVLDLGSGSGAIALALKSQRPAIQVSASDASADALSVARANAAGLGLAVEFHHGHWLAAVAGQRFDVIASNPPYIADGDPHLHALRFEPSSALCAGADGLDDIRCIVADASAALQPGGWLLLEHGHDQAQAVRALLRGAGLIQVSSRTDLAGIERCSGARSPLLR